MQKCKIPFFIFYFEEVHLIDIREPEKVTQASLPGFQVLSLQQFGN